MPHRREGLSLLGPADTGSMPSATLELDQSGQVGTVTVDYSNGDPVPVGGLYADAGRVTITGGTGADTLNTSAGSATFSNASISGSTINFPTDTPLTLTGADSTDTLNALSGHVYLAGSSTTTGPSVNISAGATVFLDGSQYLSNLTAQPGGLARVAQNGSTVVTVGAIDLQPATTEMPGGILDLCDNDLIVKADDADADDAATDDDMLSQVTGWLSAGYDNGQFDGVNYSASGPTPACIISVVSAKITTAFTAIDVLQVGGGLLNPGLFDGIQVNDGDVVCRYTYNSDVNLDGVTDDTDVSLINNGQGNFEDNSYYAESTEWSAGNVLSPAFQGEAVYGIPLQREIYADVQGWTPEYAEINTYTVNWGDGTSNAYEWNNSTDSFDPATHDYGSNPAGMYDVSIRADGYDQDGNYVSIDEPHQDLIVTPNASSDLSWTETAGGEMQLDWTDRKD